MKSKFNALSFGAMGLTLAIAAVDAYAGGVSIMSAALGHSEIARQMFNVTAIGFVATVASLPTGLAGLVYQVYQDYTRN